MAVTKVANRVVWVDLTTADLDAAIHFYEKLFGWRYDEHESGMGTYVAAHNEDGDVGGMMAQGPEQAAAGVPSSWTVYFASDQLEAMLARTRELGGSVLQPPLSIPGGGRVAVIADPTGAALALGEGEPLAVDGFVRNAPGAVVWVECLSRDPSAARAFYENLFTWRALEGTGGYTVFSLGGERVGGLMAMPPGVPAGAPSHWLVYFAADVQDVCDRVPELGGSVATPPKEIDEGRFAVLEDPTGAVFAVFEEPGS